MDDDNIDEAAGAGHGRCDGATHCDNGNTFGGEWHVVGEGDDYETVGDDASDQEGKEDNREEEDDDDDCSEEYTDEEFEEGYEEQ